MEEANLIPNSEVQKYYLKEINDIFAQKRMQHSVFEDTLAVLAEEDPRAWKYRWKRAQECSSYQTWRFVNRKADKRFVLAHGHFCRDRWCPICQWRHSMKLYSRMVRIFDYSFKTEIPELSFQGCKIALMELSLKPTPVREDDMEWTGRELGKSFDALLKGYQKFIRLKAVKDIIIGCSRFAKLCRFKDSWYPKLNVLLVANGFRKGVTKFEPIWERLYGDLLWRSKVTGVSIAEPQIDVFKIFPKIAAPIVDVNVNRDRYLVRDDPRHNAELVKMFERVFNGRRFDEFGGVFDKIYKILSGLDYNHGGFKCIKYDPEEYKDVNVMFDGYQYVFAPAVIASHEGDATNEGESDGFGYDMGKDFEFAFVAG